MALVFPFSLTLTTTARGRRQASPQRDPPAFVFFFVFFVNFVLFVVCRRHVQRDRESRSKKV
jgi:hypothetical protein